MKKRLGLANVLFCMLLLVGCRGEEKNVTALLENSIFVSNGDRLKLSISNTPFSDDTGYDTYVYESSTGSYYAFIVDRTDLEERQYKIRMLENVSLGEIPCKVQGHTVKKYSVIRTCDTTEHSLNARKGWFSTKITELSDNNE